VVCATLVLTILTPPPIARSASLPDESHVILVKPYGDALLIWNAEQLIRHFKEAGTTGIAALNEVKVSATRLLLARCLALPRATTCRIRVVYPREPEFNPQYKLNIVATMEKVMILTIQRRSAIRDGARWQKMLTANRIPADVNIEITGALPPLHS